MTEQSRKTGELTDTQTTFQTNQSAGKLIAAKFAIHDVAKATEPLPLAKTTDIFKGLLTTIHDLRPQGVLYCSDYNSKVVKHGDFNALVGAVHFAFSEHRPLVLSPDMLWLTILQGFAQHIKNTPEAFRHQFVNHAEKKSLKIQMHNFSPNSPEAEWDIAIQSFLDLLLEDLKIDASKLLCDFECSGTLERLASAVALMDAFQPYYAYEMQSGCGIPELTLEGSQRDWHHLRSKIDLLKPYELDWWLPDVKNILDQFCSAVDGRVDLTFWKHIYKQEKRYGSDELNGWLFQLFPYIRNYMTGSFDVRNPLLSSEINASDGENEPYVLTDMLPKGLSVAPFNVISQEYPDGHSMEFLSGLTGIEQDQSTLALRPKVGWGVRHAIAMDDITRCALSGMNARPPLVGAALNAEMERVINWQRGTVRISGAFISFYKQCDGYQPPSGRDQNACDLFRLKDVSTWWPTDSMQNDVKAPDFYVPFEVHESWWKNWYIMIHIGSCTDGSLILLDTGRIGWVCIANEDRQKWGFLAPSLPDFLDMLKKSSGTINGEEFLLHQM